MLKADFLTVLLEGFGLGLSTGPFCLATCGPVIVPCLLGMGSGEWKQNIRLFGLFLAGRMLAYAAYGAGVSALALPFEQGLTPALKSWGLVACGLLLAVGALLSASGKDFAARFCGLKRFAPATPFLLGAATGLSPCPPFLAGTARVFLIGNVMLGTAYFMAFFVSSSLFLLPALAATPALKRWESAKVIGQMTMALCAGWLLFLGLAGLFGGGQ